MHVDMVDRLPTHFVAVHNHTIAIFSKALLTGKLGGSKLQPPYRDKVGFIDIIECGDMFFGNNQLMRPYNSPYGFQPMLTVTINGSAAAPVDA